MGLAASKEEPVTEALEVHIEEATVIQEHAVATVYRNVVETLEPKKYNAGNARESIKKCFFNNKKVEPITCPPPYPSYNRCTVCIPSLDEPPYDWKKLVFEVAKEVLKSKKFMVTEYRNGAIRIYWQEPFKVI